MTETSPAKQEAILQTALRLLVKRGFFGTSTPPISKQAGVATGTPCFYFRTKEDLIDTLYLRVKAEAAEAMRQGLPEEKDTKGRLRRLWRNAVLWGAQNPEKMQFMEQFAHSPFISKTTHEEGLSRFSFLHEYVIQGIEEGVIRDYDPTLLFCMRTSSLSSVILRVAAIHDPEQREAIITQGMDFVWNGLSAEQGEEKHQKTRKPVRK